ncbi:MAG TPA: protein kinase [Trebonia sp.]|nr:protein kinase [Trebonia sp.]
MFVKAVRDPGRLVSSLEREAAINPAVQPLSPALRWQARGRGWLALGFEHVPGQRASFKPGSPDLPAVAAAVERIAAIPLPPVARDWRENRYDRYASGNEGLLAGSTLLHGDINPDNLLVGPGGDVTVVDWSWPAHGAAFIDPACLAVQLIAAGHAPAEAESWAARCAAWREAAPAALDAFAAAVGMYQRFEELDPQPWRKVMTAAATRWAEHRGQAAR